MKLFTVGPVQMSDNIIHSNDNGIKYFRNQEFSKKMFEIENMILRLLGANHHKMALFSCSGTGGMEAAVCSIPKDQRVLIINGGTFGKRFVNLCEIHKIKYDMITVPFQQDLTNEMLKPYLKEKYFALLCNIDETSIGKLYDKTILNDFCKQNGCYLIIDAISSAFCDDYNLNKFNADITIISSQKALALAPGLSMLIISQKYIEEVIQNQNCEIFYLDIKSHIKDMERGQTPFTPSLAEIEQLYQRLKSIKSYKDEVEKTKSLAIYFRNKIKDFDCFDIPSYNLTNCLTPVICKNNDAKIIVEKLAQKELFINPCGGDNENKMFRIGHIGNLTTDDYDLLLNELRSIL